MSRNQPQMTQMGADKEGFLLHPRSSATSAVHPQFAARMTEIRAVQPDQDASRQRLEALFQSLLHRAFHGEL